MWEVMTYGERPYWELSNHEVGSSFSQTDSVSRFPSLPYLGASLTEELWVQSSSSRGTQTVLLWLIVESSQPL